MPGSLYENPPGPGRPGGHARVLLVQAGFTRNFGITNPPLGLLYISAVLKKNGFPEVRVLHLDALHEPERRLRKELSSFRPDIVGIGALTAQAISLRAAAALAKELLPGCLVVAGGPHATLYHEDCLKDPNIDLAVRGEGEETFLEIARARAAGTGLAGIKGTCRREGVALVTEPPREYLTDLDSLPMPDWDALDPASYDAIVPCSVFAYGSRHMPIVTSRGCPYECVFCHNIMGRRYRAHSPERVLAEIEVLYHRHGVRFIEVMDDNVNLDRARFKRFLRLLAQRRPPDLTVYLAYGLRADTLDEEAIDLFRPAGIPYFAIGVESGSPRVQKLLRKNLDLPRVSRLIEYAASRRIFVHGLFMIGVPGETEEDIRQTIEFACASKLHTVLISTCFVYKSTRLAAMTGGSAVMLPEADVNHFSGYRGFSGCSDLPPSRLRLLKFLFNVGFYYSPARAWRVLRDLPRYTPGLLLLLARKLLRRSLPFA